MSKKSREQKRRARASSSAASKPAQAESAAPAISKAARRRLQKKRAKQAAKASSDHAGDGGGRAGRKRVPAAAASSSLEVVHEDEHVIAINKPAGLLCHPSDGFWESGTVFHALEGRQRLPGYSELSPEMLQARQSHTGEHDSFIPRTIVHRLDRGTTGLMLLAKTPAAESHLGWHFRQKTASAASADSASMRKRYVAVLCGLPRLASSGASRAGPGLESGLRIDVPLDRDPARPGKMAVAAPGRGKSAMTIIHVHAHRDVDEGCGGKGSEVGGLSLVSVELLTGRQHQIRVHCAHAGAPLANDDGYGSAETVRAFRRAFGPLPRNRPLLHAWSMEVPHPAPRRDADSPQRDTLLLRAPLPADMLSIIAKLWPELSRDPSEWPAHRCR